MGRLLSFIEGVLFLCACCLVLSNCGSNGCVDNRSSIPLAVLYRKLKWNRQTKPSLVHHKNKIEPKEYYYDYPHNRYCHSYLKLSNTHIKIELLR